MNLQEQFELFEDCRFDLGKMRVRLPDGSVVDRKRFNVVFGGHTFDMGTDRKSRSAWNAYLHNVVPHQRKSPV